MADPKKVRIAAAVLALTLVPITAHYEGLRLDTYLDIGGKPTICYGHTKGVILGMHMTKQECDAVLRSEATLSINEIDHQVKIDLDDKPRLAFADFAYNVGFYNFRTSTLLKIANTGDVAGACHQLPRWSCITVQKGQGDIKGPCKKSDLSKKFSATLFKRRTDEMNLCLGGPIIGN